MELAYVFIINMLDDKKFQKRSCSACYKTCYKRVTNVLQKNRGKFSDFPSANSIRWSLIARFACHATPGPLVSLCQTLRHAQRGMQKRKAHPRISKRKLIITGS